MSESAPAVLALAALAACAVPPHGARGDASGAPAPTAAPAWRELFDGRSLAGIDPVQFGGEGRVRVADGRLVLEPGSPLTGVTFAATLPPSGYELEVVGARVLGSDFFCALTFPVARGCLSLVLGGWGGAVCGLSSLDGEDAAHNATRHLRAFAAGVDYRARVRVTDEQIAVWLDDAPWFAIDPRPHDCRVRAELDLCQPLGLASYATKASIAQVRWRPLAYGSAP